MPWRMGKLVLGHAWLVVQLIRLALLMDARASLGASLGDTRETAGPANQPPGNLGRSRALRNKRGISRRLYQM
ncbi:uncharacterized protein V1518DRAFT_417385 [Limtongia smithiae]|uniref:uncharacterized protein n=1 Tax=Limtongia smithiae TaxID=1125753 RepID=UPI0034CF3B78